MNLETLHADIFNLVLGLLNSNECVALMITCKTLRDKIGKNSIWKKFCTILSLQDPLKYTKLCIILDENKLYPTNIKIRDYYAEEYYSWRFCEITPFIQFRLRDICFAGYSAILQFKEIVEEICQRSYIYYLPEECGFDDEDFKLLENYELIVENYEIIAKLIDDIDDSILSKIIVPYYGFENNRLTIDVKNNTNAVRQMIKNANNSLVIIGNEIFQYNDNVLNYHSQNNRMFHDIDIIASKHNDGYFHIFNKHTKEQYEIIPSEIGFCDSTFMIPDFDPTHILCLLPNGSFSTRFYTCDVDNTIYFDDNKYENINNYCYTVGKRIGIDGSLLCKNLFILNRFMSSIYQKKILKTLENIERVYKNTVGINAENDRFIIDFIYRTC
jgi:hypothetical protein